MIDTLFTQSLICPHCKCEFHAPRVFGLPIVTQGAAFVCPKCNKLFTTSLIEQLLPEAKPWPLWVFVLMLLSIVVLLISPAIAFYWLYYADSR
jgi:uncharacterized Zn-finger protein